MLLFKDRLCQREKGKASCGRTPELTGSVCAGWFSLFVHQHRLDKQTFKCRFQTDSKSYWTISTNHEHCDKGNESRAEICSVSATQMTDSQQYGHRLMWHLSYIQQHVTDSMPPWPKAEQQSSGRGWCQNFFKVRLLCDSWTAVWCESINEEGCSYWRCWMGLRLGQTVKKSSSNGAGWVCDVLSKRQS